MFDARLHRIRGCERVGARRELDGKAGRGLAVEAADDAIILSAKLHTGDVAQAQGRAVRIGAQDDVAELLRCLKTGQGGHRRVEFLPLERGLGANFAGRNLRVLRFDGVAHIAWHQTVIAQLERIEPDAHGVLGAEHAHLAHAGHARQWILHGAAQVIGNIDVGVSPGRVVEADDHQEIRLRFAHRDAKLRHFLWQQRKRLLHLVLDLNLGDIRIGAGRERRADADIAGGIAAR